MCNICLDRICKLGDNDEATFGVLHNQTPCNSSIFTSAKKPMTYTWGPMMLTSIYLPEPYSSSILPASIWFDAAWSNNSIDEAIVQCFLSIESLYSTQILGHLQICKASNSISQAQRADYKTVLMGTTTTTTLLFRLWTNLLKRLTSLPGNLVVNIVPDTTQLLCFVQDVISLSMPNPLLCQNLHVEFQCWQGYKSWHDNWSFHIQKVEKNLKLLLTCQSLKYSSSI